MGVVYMLVFENLHYIGSTIQDLRQRINNHKFQYKGWLKDKTKYYYCNSFEIIQNENFEVIEIEEIENETKEECREREQNWIEFYGRENLINNNNANGLNTENNKKYHKKYDKEYYKNNREKKLKYQKDYYEKNKK